MFESHFNNIVSCINTLSTFLCRDEKKREQIYLEEIEELLESIIKVFTTYYPFEKSFTISYPRINKILLDNEQWLWNLSISQQNKNLTSKELAHYFWENKVSISSFLYSVFNNIQKPLSQKLDNFKKKDKEYEASLESARQGKKQLDLLLDDKLLTKLQINQKGESENKSD